jgi:spore coat protein A
MSAEPVPESQARLRALAETGGLALPSSPTAPRRPSVIDARDLAEGRVLPICARPFRTQLHADLPDTEIWGYEGSVPGPTIVVRSGHPVRIDWGNALVSEDAGGSDERAALPYDVVRVPPQPGGVADTVRIATFPEAACRPTAGTARRTPTPCWRAPTRSDRPPSSTCTDP